MKLMPKLTYSERFIKTRQVLFEKFDTKLELKQSVNFLLRHYIIDVSSGKFKTSVLYKATENNICDAIKYHELIPRILKACPIYTQSEIIKEIKKFFISHELLNETLEKEFIQNYGEHF